MYFAYDLTFFNPLPKSKETTASQLVFINTSSLNLQQEQTLVLSFMATDASSIKDGNRTAKVASVNESGNLSRLESANMSRNRVLHRKLKARHIQVSQN